VDLKPHSACGWINSPNYADFRTRPADVWET
jgi:hypothetical protein